MQGQPALPLGSQEVGNNLTTVGYVPTLHPSTAVSKGSAAALAQLCWPLLSLSLSAFTTTNSEICTSVLKWKADKFFPFIHSLGSIFSFITIFFSLLVRWWDAMLYLCGKNLFLVFTACSINSYLVPEPPTLLPQASFSPQFPTGLFSPPSFPCCCRISEAHM